MFQASVFLREMQENAPDILQTCNSVLSSSHCDKSTLYLDAESFGQCRSESIDYAIMEHTKNGVAIPMDAQWSDVGSWNALWECSEKDENGNVCVGNVTANDVTNCYLYSNSKCRMVVVGMSDHIIVEKENAVLVVAKDRCQEIKKIIEKD